MPAPSRLVPASMRRKGVALPEGRSESSTDPSSELCSATHHRISFGVGLRCKRSNPCETSAWRYLPAFWQTDSSVCNILQRRTKNRYCSHLRSSFVFAGFACALQTLPQRSYLCRRPDYRSVESDRHRLRGSQALFCYLASLCSAKTSSFWVSPFSCRHRLQSIFVMQTTQDTTRYGSCAKKMRSMTRLVTSRRSPSLQTRNVVGWSAWRKRWRREWSVQFPCHNRACSRLAACRPQVWPFRAFLARPNDRCNLGPSQSVSRCLFHHREFAAATGARHSGSPLQSGSPPRTGTRCAVLPRQSGRHRPAR